MQHLILHWSTVCLIRDYGIIRVGFVSVNLSLHFSAFYIHLIYFCCLFLIDAPEAQLVSWLSHIFCWFINVPYKQMVDMTWHVLRYYEHFQKIWYFCAFQRSSKHPFVQHTVDDQMLSSVVVSLVCGLFSCQSGSCRVSVYHIQHPIIQSSYAFFSFLEDNLVTSSRCSFPACYFWY